MVGPGVKTSVRIRYDNPKDVGADRIANALAAYSKYGGPIVVIDFGTAVTYDAINAEGDYLGGAGWPRGRDFPAGPGVPEGSLRPGQACGPRPGDRAQHGGLYP